MQNSNARCLGISSMSFEYQVLRIELIRALHDLGRQRWGRIGTSGASSYEQQKFHQVAQGPEPRSSLVLCHCLTHNGTLKGTTLSSNSTPLPDYAGFASAFAPGQILIPHRHTPGCSETGLQCP